MSTIMYSARRSEYHTSSKCTILYDTSDTDNLSIGLTRSMSTSSYTTQTETENETPPESPVRSTIVTDDVVIAAPPPTPNTQLDDIGILFPAHIGEIVKLPIKLPCLPSGGDTAEGGYEAEGEGKPSPGTTFRNRSSPRPRSIKLDNGWWKRRRGQELPISRDSTPQSSPSNFQWSQPVSPPSTTPRPSRPAKIDLSTIPPYQPSEVTLAGLGLGFPPNTSRAIRNATDSVHPLHHGDLPSITLTCPQSPTRSVSAPLAHSPRASPVFPSSQTFAPTPSPVIPRDFLPLPKPPRLGPTILLCPTSPLDLPEPIPPIRPPFHRRDGSTSKPSSVSSFFPPTRKSSLTLLKSPVPPTLLQSPKFRNGFGFSLPDGRKASAPPILPHRTSTPSTPLRAFIAAAEDHTPVTRKEHKTTPWSSPQLDARGMASEGGVSPLELDDGGGLQVGLGFGLATSVSNSSMAAVALATTEREGVEDHLGGFNPYFASAVYS